MSIGITSPSTAKIRKPPPAKSIRNWLDHLWATSRKAVRHEQEQTRQYPDIYALLASITEDVLGIFDPQFQEQNLRVDRIRLDLVRPDPIQPRRVLPERIHQPYENWCKPLRWLSVNEDGHYDGVINHLPDTKDENEIKQKGMLSHRV